MEKELTPEESAFCIDYVDHNNATKAYEDNFKCEGVYRGNITRRAIYLVKKKHILNRILELAKIKGSGEWDVLIKKSSDTKIRNNNPLIRLEWISPNFPPKDTSPAAILVEDSRFGICVYAGYYDPQFGNWEFEGLELYEFEVISWFPIPSYGGWNPEDY